MPKYAENSEVFILRKTIANMFFENGQNLSIGDMMSYEPAKDLLSRLFDLEGKDKNVAKRHYLQNLRAWASKTLVAKDVSVESENNITIKKVRMQKVSKIKICPDKIDNNEHIENIEQVTQTSYETSRITQITFKSELGRLTESALQESVRYIKQQKQEFTQTFQNEDAEIKSKIQDWENKVNKSEERLNDLKKEVNQKLTYFKAQLQAVSMNENYDFDEKFKTAKQSYEMILKAHENELKQHELLMKKHEAFLKNISTHQDWREKGKRQIQIHEELLFKIQQTYSGIIANDMRLVEGNYVKKDVNEVNNNESNADSIKTISNLIGRSYSENIE